MDREKIKALITLLDDPNDEIFASVEGALLKEQVEIVPELEKAWESSYDDLFQSRVENIIHSIQLNDVHSEMKKWLQTPHNDVLYGAYLVCKYQFPDVSLIHLKEQLSELRKDIWLEMNEHLTSLEKIRIVNHVMFDVHKFSRNTSKYLAPENNYISEVLETHKGNPLSVSVIYSILCRELGMPVYGVNLPKNYILAFIDESAVADNEQIHDQTAVLFYINPINKGAVLGRKEIEYFIKQQKLQPKEEYFLPCDNITTIKRMLSNLSFGYDSKGEESKKDEIQKILALFDEIDENPI
ncbi:transglutaminase family protein [Carboxylicivirga sp. A043]|uniref:transglutaminase-like domain-containing protein n=1 Tax=Carboxylicivirga litoralis TaxID=2816963 RepID=UPI0021CB360F|nr:transglutaminase-like domain-containing protein [Carboxylicivirga sp. A043]MCU4157995.1 transglutaminase family protein [Carboxylicivirga sp. A043]